MRVAKEWEFQRNEEPQQPATESKAPADALLVLRRVTLE
jgi:hypothetical protein